MSRCSWLSHVDARVVASVHAQRVRGDGRGVVGVHPPDDEHVHEDLEGVLKRLFKSFLVEKLRVLRTGRHALSKPNRIFARSYHGSKCLTTETPCDERMVSLSDRLTRTKSGAMYMTIALMTITSSLKRNGVQKPKLFVLSLMSCAPQFAL